MKNVRFFALGICMTVFGTVAAFGQSDFRPGYVVTLANDTIQGKINYKNNSSLSHSCQFQSESGTVTTYLPAELSAYQFSDGRYFVSKNVSDQPVFLEFLVKGRLNLYSSTDSQGEHFYIEKEDQPFVELPYTAEIRESESGTRYFYESDRHLGLLALYTQDAPQLRKDITDIKKPEKKPLMNLAKKYHNAVCDYACVVYERKPYPFKINVEPVVGYYGSFDEYYWSSDARTAKKLNFLTGGVLAHIWMPEHSERLYLKTGVVYMRHSEESFFKIPLQLEYLFFSGAVQPKLAAGVSFYFPDFDFSLTVSAGVNIKLTKRLYASLTYDFEMIRNAELTGFKALGHSASAGLYIVF